jgi:type II secretory pathway component PulK
VSAQYGIVIMKTGSWTNDRGIALLIVLLVTSLLIALIFEFAYATRISLNSAVNFRDSQRAYFLARSGVFLFAKYQQLQDHLPQGEWGVVPIVSEGDTLVRIKWEDEAGKISIPLVAQGNVAYKRLQQLFDIKEISQDVLDNKILEKKSFSLLSELHQVMSDEEYAKVKDYLTTAPVQTININTASLDVLRILCRSLGKDDSVASLIINKRNEKPFETTSEITNMPGMEPLVASYLGVTSTTYTVYSYATVGGYTRQVEAIIQRGGGGALTSLYWRAL